MKNKTKEYLIASWGVLSVIALSAESDESVSLLTESIYRVLCLCSLGACILAGRRMLRTIKNSGHETRCKV